MKNAIALLAVAGTVGAASGQNLIDPNLPGVTDFDAWNSVTLSRTNLQVSTSGLFPVSPFDTFQPWFGAIDSSIQALNDNGTPDVTDDFGDVLDPTGNAGFTKVSGAGYPASASIYAGFFPATSGTFSAFDADAIADIETVVLQISAGQGSSGSLDAGGFELFINGGSTPIAPVFSGITSSGIVNDPTVGDLNTDAWLVQYDLRGLGPITSFDAQFSTVGSSSTIRGIQLDQGSQFVLVPAPASAALLGLGGLAAARRRR
ncbi:MAG: PEP-CTERM sorting domain-containing protein [Planctomycetota bacterium]